MQETGEAKPHSECAGMIRDLFGARYIIMDITDHKPRGTSDPVYELTCPHGLVLFGRMVNVRRITMPDGEPGLEVIEPGQP